jgi:hypothetical protein
MITADQFHPVSIQVSGWSGTVELNQRAVLIDALQRWSSVYNADPISLPSLPTGIPLGVMQEVPTTILQSRDQTQRLDLGRSRINLHWAVNSEQEPLDLAASSTTLAERLTTLFAHGGANLARLALVVNRLATVENPGRELCVAFCKPSVADGPLSTVQGFELHTHQVVTITPQVRANHWTRLKTATTPGQTGYQYVLLEQDLNTLAEEITTRRFTRRTTLAFFERALEQANTQLPALLEATRQPVEEGQGHGHRRSR